MTLSHVEDDELVPVPAQLIEIERETPEPRKDLRANASVHTLDQLPQLSAASLFVKTSIANRSNSSQHFYHQI